MVLLLREEATPDQIAQMLADWEVLIKVWGANWYPASRDIHFEALINIRPRQGNRRMQIENEAIRDKMEPIIRRVLEDFSSVKARYLRDPLPVRLGGLAADLARIGPASVNPLNGGAVQVLLEEARRFIEWTAAALDVEIAGELIDLQLTLTLWLHAWEEAQAHAVQRALLAHEANYGADRVLALSGLTSQPVQGNATAWCLPRRSEVL